MTDGDRHGADENANDIVPATVDEDDERDISLATEDGDEPDEEEDDIDELDGELDEEDEDD